MIILFTSQAGLRRLLRALRRDQPSFLPTGSRAPSGAVIFSRISLFVAKKHSTIILHINVASCLFMLLSYAHLHAHFWSNSPPNSALESVRVCGQLRTDELCCCDSCAPSNHRPPRYVNASNLEIRPVKSPLRPPIIRHRFYLRHFAGVWRMLPGSRTALPRRRASRHTRGK
jgi:hypothetical protein